MIQGFQISSDLTGLLQTFIKEEGLDLPDVDAALCRYQTSTRMPITEWWFILESLSTRLKRPTLGIHIGQHLQLVHCGVLGYLSLSCLNVAEVLTRFERFQRLLYEGSQSTIVAGNGWVGLRWTDTYDRICQVSDDLLFAAMLTFLRMLTGDANGKIQPVFVHFHGAAPADIAEYERFFGCEVLFGQGQNAVAIPQACLDWPLATANPQMRGLIEQQAEVLLSQIPAFEAFHERLQQTLLRALHDGEPTIETIASTMHMSARTLQRRLREKDLCFREVLQRTRLAFSRQYLQDLHLNLQEIAYLLGYSEQSAFNRAFKHWTGMTPQSYRRQHFPM